MVYTAIKSSHDRTDISFQSKWIGNMTRIPCENGLNFVWMQQESVDCKWLKNVLPSRISDINIQNWHNEMAVNSHCVSYQLFKDNLRLEPYNYNVIDTMCKFRCGNSNIPYISGRFQKIRTERLCNLCDDGVPGVVGDEFHYILV